MRRRPCVVVVVVVVCLCVVLSLRRAPTGANGFSGSARSKRSTTHSHNICVITVSRLRVCVSLCVCLVGLSPASLSARPLAPHTRVCVYVCVRACVSPCVRARVGFARVCANLLLSRAPCAVWGLGCVRVRGGGGSAAGPLCGEVSSEPAPLAAHAPGRGSWALVALTPRRPKGWPHTKRGRMEPVVVVGVPSCVRCLFVAVLSSAAAAAVAAARRPPACLLACVCVCAALFVAGGGRRVACLGVGVGVGGENAWAASVACSGARRFRTKTREIRQCRICVAAHVNLDTSGTNRPSSQGFLGPKTRTTTRAETHQARTRRRFCELRSKSGFARRTVAQRACCAASGRGAARVRVLRRVLGVWVLGGAGLRVWGRFRAAAALGH